MWPWPTAAFAPSPETCRLLPGKQPWCPTTDWFQERTGSRWVDQAEAPPFSLERWGLFVFSQLIHFFLDSASQADYPLNHRFPFSFAIVPNILSFWRTR